MQGFSLFVELHRKGSAINSATMSSFTGSRTRLNILQLHLIYNSRGIRVHTSTSLLLSHIVFVTLTGRCPQTPVDVCTASWRPPPARYRGSCRPPRRSPQCGKCRWSAPARSSSPGSPSPAGTWRQLSGRLLQSCVHCILKKKRLTYLNCYITTQFDT